MATYEYDGATTLSVGERHLYGSDHVGLVQGGVHNLYGLTDLSNTQPALTPATGQYRYELKDHLGNVAVVITGDAFAVDENGDHLTDYFAPKVLEYHGYEPFGSLLPGRNYVATGTNYPTGFQGQRKDDEVYGAQGSALSFEYRVHDARVGRFFSIDPLAPKYPHNSPYAFSENRVSDGVELEGLEYAWLMGKLANAVENSSPVLAGAIRGIIPFASPMPQVDMLIDYVANGPPTLEQTKEQALNLIPFRYGIKKIQEGGTANVTEGVVNIVGTGLLLRAGMESGVDVGEPTPAQMAAEANPVKGGPSLNGKRVGQGTTAARPYTVAAAKYDYFFGRVTTGLQKNIERSAQNLKDLTAMGITSEEQLAKAFDEAAKNPVQSIRRTDYGVDITRSVQVGDKGAIDVRFHYENGNMEATPKITSIVPKLTPKNE